MIDMGFKKICAQFYNLIPIPTKKGRNIFREDLDWKSIERGIDSNVENRSKSGRLVLKSDWILNQFYLIHIEARIWPIPLTKTDRSDMLWLWMATWHCDQTKIWLSEISWKSEKMVFGDDLLISLQLSCWFIEPETVFQFHARKQLSVTGNFDFVGPQECFNWFIHNYGPSKSKSFAVISIRPWFHEISPGPISCLDKIIIYFISA